ncbi:MAG: cell division protein ZapA [Alistipes sp.]|nr:cell division protein ZapA [Alistipes sp.]
MEKPKQRISLKLAGKPYQMNIESDKEEVYRLAEREVNTSVNRWKKAFGDNFSTQDCLATTALLFSINNITTARQNQMEDEDMKALDALSQRLDKHLNRIPRRTKTKK